MLTNDVLQIALLDGVLQIALTDGILQTSLTDTEDRHRRQIALTDTKDSALQTASRQYFTDKRGQTA